MSAQFGVTTVMTIDGDLSQKIPVTVKVRVRSHVCIQHNIIQYNVQYKIICIL